MFRSRTALTVFTIAMITMLFSIKAYAVPAAPFVVELSQPDGTVFWAVQWGDENLSGWETAEGYSIVFDNFLNRWTYVVRGSDGSLISSGRVVGVDSPPDVPLMMRPEGLPMVLKRLTRELRGAEGGPMAIPAPQLVVPPTGTGQIPVLLINYADRTFTHTTTQFNTLLFGTGNNSMKDYYSEISYGAFTVAGTVLGIYTSTYGHDYYGTDVSSPADDAFPGTLVREAVAAADPSLNFASYDLDGDCYVDVVAIVHQGEGQEAGGAGTSTDIWSHRWDLNSANSAGSSNGGEYTTNDNCTANPSVKVKVND